MSDDIIGRRGRRRKEETIEDIQQKLASATSSRVFAGQQKHAAFSARPSASSNGARRRSRSPPRPSPPVQAREATKVSESADAAPSTSIVVLLNDRLGKKLRIHIGPNETIGELKRLAAQASGARADKLRLQKGDTVLKNHILLSDYEINDGVNLELYYS